MRLKNNKPAKAISIAILWISVGLMDAGWTCKTLDAQFYATSHRDHVVFAVFIGLWGPLGFPVTALITACGEDGWGFERPANRNMSRLQSANAGESQPVETTEKSANGENE